MKKKNWISFVLILLCLGVLLGYQALDRIRTDRTAPVITVEEQTLELSARDPREMLLAGVTARDKADGDVTASLVVESVWLVSSDGTAAVTYAAFDSSGNVAKQTREVRFTDYESPRFTLEYPLLFSLNRSYDVLGAVTAQDMLDGDITHRIRATVLDEVPSGYSGTYNVQFRVTNSLGDTVVLELPVELYTPGLFEGNLTLTDYLVYVKQGSRFNAEKYLDTFAVGRESFSLRSGIPGQLKLTVSGKVDTNTPGIYMVDYRITYNTGREYAEQVYTAYSKLIVVVEG